MSCRGGIEVVDGVIACVWTEDGEHPGVVVSDCADMELLSPAACMVHNCELIEHGASEFC